MNKDSPWCIRAVLHRPLAPQRSFPECETRMIAGDEMNNLEQPLRRAVEKPGAPEE
jgi:hypothetical protein